MHVIQRCELSKEFVGVGKVWIVGAIIIGLLCLLPDFAGIKQLIRETGFHGVSWLMQFFDGFDISNNGGRVVGGTEDREGRRS